MNRTNLGIIFRATLCLFLAGAIHAADVTAETPGPQDEALFFIPPGRTNEGRPITLVDQDAARIRIVVRDHETGKPTCCRINVVGDDGNFYQPETNPLTPFSLTGEWPKNNAKGNRREKGPFRYLGRFFYATGDTTVAIPAGNMTVEVSKGFEFKPVSISVNVTTGKTLEVPIELTRAAPMQKQGYVSGDTHLHFVRATDQDEETIFDLLDAEDIQIGTPLGYNEPAGPYSGFMDKMDSPQLRGLGYASIKSRGLISILSGQEYRSGQYGHLNLFCRDRLIFDRQDLNADEWPVYGLIGRETKLQGGFSIHAHGGYGLEIYADAALGTVDAVELLQFGVFRGIGLSDWYHMLNAGYRFPCVGASDYPACRFLGDCRTYVDLSDDDVAKPRKDAPSDRAPQVQKWFERAVGGRSFVTTGPLLLLEIDGKRPGQTIERPNENSALLKLKASVRCEVAPVSKLDVIINGKVHESIDIPPAQQRADWFEVSRTIPFHESSWVAIRAWSVTSKGLPDSESHSNPVYIYLNGRKPYQQASVDAWIAKIDGQLDKHRTRTFAQKSMVLDYFQRARDLLLSIRESRGLKTTEDPAQISLDREKQDAPTLAADVSRSDATDEELREFLKPVPAKSPAEALKTFEGVNGFEMQLVAAEPLVHSPIAACFDEDGNLFVCEMRDYPYKPTEGLEPIGSVRLLRDVDGDGVYDEAHLFADKLLWAAGVVPWRGGVFVAAPPNIWYFKDTDGDFKADIKQKVFTGFGTDNQQAMVNNLQWGIDHWIYGATAGNGGSIRPGDLPDASPISTNGRDFRFDPISETFQAITGTVQFGNTFDDWGNRFVCSESQPLIQIVLPDHYLARNPFLAAPAGTLNIAPGPVPIFRISPIERWRQIRSSRRIATNRRAATSAGASHHVIDAAAGVTIYRGGAFPKEYYGQAFVGDGQNNLIHRRSLTPHGVVFKSDRVDDGTDFIRSSDIWFRPVNLINAPDGTLYCCDMAREVLESIHIPLDVVKHLDLKSGRDRGRIYRIAPAGFKSPPPPRMSTLATKDLVNALESPHGWWRETAHRLLFERQDRSCVDALRDMVSTKPSAQARLLALYSLEGLSHSRKSARPENSPKSQDVTQENSPLDEATLLVALNDPHPGVRENAIRIAESHAASSAKIRDKILLRTSDDDARVRYQTAFTLGEINDVRVVKALGQLVQRDGDDVWIRTAILSSANRIASELFEELTTIPSPRSAGTEIVMGDLAQIVGAQNQPAATDRVLQSLATSLYSSDTTFSDKMLANLARGLRRVNGKLDPTANDGAAGSRLLKERLEQAAIVAKDTQLPVNVRVDAIGILASAPNDSHFQLLCELLSVDQPEPIQIAAIKGITEDRARNPAKVLLELWNTFTPEPRRVVIEVLLAREEWVLMYLVAAQQEKVTLTDIDPIQREVLRKHRKDEIRNLAGQLFGQGSSQSRKAVVDDYQQSLKLKGDAQLGLAVFEKTCTSCHQLAGKGFPIGPNLASTASREPSTLLTHILDPNQYVAPNYLQYSVSNKDGRVYTGLITSQTATSITLKRERNETITILRGEIDEISGGKKSLMPEGLEKDIPLQSMADLITYLTDIATTSANPNDVRDYGTLPGLIETNR